MLNLYQKYHILLPIARISLHHETNTVVWVNFCPSNKQDFLETVVLEEQEHSMDSIHAYYSHFQILESQLEKAPFSKKISHQ